MSLLSDLEKAAEEFTQRPVVPPPVPPKPLTKAPCCGNVAKIKDLARTTKDFLMWLIEAEVCDEEYVRRLRICRKCDAKDSKGVRLYRDETGAHGPTCGEYRFASPEAALRDSTVDGCGCYLAAKAIGVSQQCPLGKWAKEETQK
jgi:hypothetical protein